MTASARGVPGNNFSGRRGTPPGPAGMSSIAFPMPDDLPQPLAASLPKRDQSLQHLTLRAAQGDQEAFAALHQRLGGGLHRLFMERTGGRTELADDFCQKTWVAVWQALEGGKYDPERAAISTFVYAVGYRVWLQHMRSAGRARAHLDAAAPGMAALGLSEDPAAGSRLAEMIQIGGGAVDPPGLDERGDGPGPGEAAGGGGEHGQHPQAGGLRQAAPTLRKAGPSRGIARPERRGRGITGAWWERCHE